MEAAAGTTFFAVCAQMEFHETGNWSLTALLDHLSEADVQRGCEAWIFSELRIRRSCRLGVTVQAPGGKTWEMTPGGLEIEESRGEIQIARWDGRLSRKSLPWDGEYQFVLLCDGKPIAMHPLLVGTALQPLGSRRLRVPRPLAGDRGFFVWCFLPCEKAVQDASGVWSISRAYNQIAVHTLPHRPEEWYAFLRGVFVQRTVCSARVVTPQEAILGEWGRLVVEAGNYATYNIRLADLAFDTAGVYMFELLCNGQTAATYPLDVALEPPDGLVV